MTWTKDNTHRPDTITCDILVQATGTHGYPRWKRADGFGHMTDDEVFAYMAARPRRYPEVLIASMIEEART